MKLRDFKMLAGLCGLLVLVSTACVDSRYNMDKVSGKMAFGGDSISIPLVSSDSIFLKDIVDLDKIEMISTDENGYRIEQKDSFHIAMSAIGAISVDDQSYSPDPIQVAFIDASQTQLTISGIHQSNRINVGLGNLSVEDIDIPAVDMQENFNSSVGDFALTDAQKTLSMNPIAISQSNIFGSATLPAELEPYANALDNLPDYLNVPITLNFPGGNFLAVNMQQSMNFGTTVPDGITSVDWIALKKSTPARLGVSMSIENASELLYKGAVTTHIAIDPAKLFRFAAGTLNGEGKIWLEETLNKGNNYAFNKTYYIDSLVLNAAASNGSLNISDQFQAQGVLSVSEVQYYADNFNNIRNVKLKMDITVDDMTVHTMQFEIPARQTNVSGNTSIQFSSTLPEDVTKVDSIVTVEPSYIAITLRGSNSIAGLKGNIKIDALSIAFPQEFVFAPTEGLNQETNVFSIADEAFDPVNGKTIMLPLKRIDMSETTVTVDHKILWSKEVTYNGTLSVAGKVNSDDIPSGQASFSMSVNSSIKAGPVHVVINSINQPLEEQKVPINFVFSTADMISAVQTATIEDGTFLKIKLVKPKTLPITGNIVIQFPKMMEFADDPHLDKTNNQYIIAGELPDEISLELKKLVINQFLDNGMLSVKDSVTVNGTVAIAGGPANSDDLKQLSTEDMSMDIHLDDMHITDVDANITGIKAEYRDSASFTTPIEIPAEILAIDSIILKEGANLTLEINVQNLPNVSEDIIIDFRLQAPDKFLLQSEDVNEMNYWNFKEKLVNNTPIVKSVLVRGIDLSGEKLEGTYNLNEFMRYNINVSMNSANLHSSDLAGEPITIKADIKLEGVQVEKVYGLVSPTIDAIHEEISLEDFPEQFKGEDTRLDINPILMLNTSYNLAIPLNINGMMTPYYGEVPNMTKAQSMELALDGGKPEAPSTNNFWISATDEGKPDDYTFVKVDINKLFETIPDKITLDMEAHTDISSQHQVDLGADYAADIKYDLLIPLAFGENLNLTYKDTLMIDLNLESDDKDEQKEKKSITDYLGESIQIIGMIENSIPLNLTGSLIPIDEENDPIDSIDPVNFEIKAGKADGSATTSPITIAFKNDGHQFDRLAGFIMEFKVSSDATVAGTSIKPDNYLKARLFLRIIGGIVIDADDF